MTGGPPRVGDRFFATYDAADELTADSTGNTYSYNKSGDLTSKTESGTTTSYAYDYENRMTGATTGGVTTSFTYD